jgi:hypothetical protein
VRGACIITVYSTPRVPEITLTTFAAGWTLARTEEYGPMKTYAFDVVLKDTSEVSDEQADALFSAGCDDGTPTSCNGAAWIHFDREASSLEEAIRSAVAQVQAAGFQIGKVELDAAAAVSLGM